ITLIQRLVLFLGYPTYSLTVTLAAILLSTGVGALLSSRYQPAPATPPGCSSARSRSSPCSTRSA
ncbi:MAG TPA: hypothetical protein VE487_15970, partial [Ilumatobacter sp.]|nr:hypothetical protein [Ilumatobacter sp.]